VYVDSTLIQASAAVDLMVPREDRVQPPLSIEEYVQRLYTENDPPSEDDELPPPPGPRLRRGREQEALSQPNRKLQSKTDPEATLVNRPEFGRHLAYKAHVAVAGKRGQVITAAVATTGIEADEHLLAEVLWQHRRLSGLKLGEVVADAKYGTGPNYLYLDQAGLPAFIPTTRFGNQHTGIWGREHFTWLAEEDAYLCPAGQKLRRYANLVRTRRVQYRAPQGACVACPFRAQCAPSGIERALHRAWALDLVEAAQDRVASARGKQRLTERKIYVEGTFGLAKELHGLRRTRFRGRRRVQIQLWLTAAAMNIKRAIRQMAGKGRPVLPALFAIVLISLLRSLESAAYQRPQPA
jgi:hypothetical protein